MVFGHALQALSAPLPATAAPPPTGMRSSESGPVASGSQQMVSQGGGENALLDPLQLPMTRAEARRRYGEIRPASDRVGPPLPLTVKNVVAVAADAALKTAVGMATIGNFVDQPRGNLNEIGTGLGVLRTTVGERFGVDVDNPRFGLASDLLPFTLTAAAKRRGGPTKPQGDASPVYGVERGPQVYDPAQMNRRPSGARIRLTPEDESGGVSGHQPRDGSVKRVGANSNEITEVPLDEIKPIHPVPRPGKPAGYIDNLASSIQVDGFDLRRAVNIVVMPNGLKVTFGGHHRIAAMKELKQSTIPAKVVNWTDMSAKTQQRWLQDFPNIADYLK